MKDKRIISVKDPKLRKIRDGLRMLLVQASSAEWNKIYDEMEGLRFDKDENRISVDDWTPSQLKRFRELQRLKNENRKMGEKSICMCFNCGKSDQDMYYNYPYRAWFCVECVEFLRKGYAKMKAKKARGEYMCDPDSEFGQSFF